MVYTKIDKVEILHVFRPSKTWSSCAANTGTFSAWRKKLHAKVEPDIYKTSGSIENSQRIRTEINESSTIAKMRIWVHSDTVHSDNI